MKFHVLVDILLRELNDIPMESDLRVDFLVAMENLMQNSPWFSKGQYRKDDIREALNGILEAYEGDSSFSKAAYVCCCCCLESFIHSLLQKNLPGTRRQNLYWRAVETC